MNKKLIAEAFGTFILALVVIFSSTGTFPVPTPILAAITVGVFVYTIGAISGCHLNPAITLGLFGLGKMTRESTFQYIAAQVIGAAGALALATFAGVTWYVGAEADLYSYIFEFMGTLVLAFGIAAVVFDTTKTVTSGLIIGGSLLVGVSLSVLGGGPGILNPAVAIALKTSDLGFYLAQILGGFLGFQLCHYLFMTPKAIATSKTRKK
jgi:glycerol uptake facilitator-like aquaporin